MAASISKCPFHNTESIREFDALDINTRANPLPFYDWLRESEQRTLYKLPHESNFYLVHRYEDVKRVLSDSENFSSKIIPVKKSPFFVLMDGDEHKRIREIASEVLSQKNILLMENEITKIIQEATLELLGKESTELFSAWADKIPLKILAKIFGMDASDKSISQIHKSAIDINRALFVTGGTGPRRSNQPSIKEKFLISTSLIKNSPLLFKLIRLIGLSGTRELIQMFKVINKNGDIPRPDFAAIPHAITPLLELMLHFAQALSEKNNKGNVALEIMRNEIASHKASMLEMVMCGAFILFAGYETTASLLSNAVVHLSKHEETFEQLKKHPDHVEAFAEECLRYYTPVGRFLRKAINDVEVNGCVIPKDSIVIVLTGAANTDPGKFDDGCKFDYSRSNSKQHLSFGKGAHYCIGAPLARLQIISSLKCLIENTKKISLIENKPLQMVVDRDNGILRYEEVWLSIEPLD